LKKKWFGKESKNKKEDETINTSSESNNKNIVNKDDDNFELTQSYSTWGDKLLQHTDVLNSIQNEKTFKPITVQLAPVESCDSDCPFCSVADRPIKSYMKFKDIKKVLDDFKSLGAKSLELTGGGNPMLYRDRETREDINDIIEYAHSLNYDIGIITNSNNIKKIKKDNHHKINWIRISLIKLDEGKNPKDYFFNDFPYEKLSFSYIIYDGIKNKEGEYIPDELSRTKRVYKGTTVKTIERMAELVELHPDIKFVRIAGNCLIKGNNAKVKSKYYDIIKRIDKLNKFFVKDIGYEDYPYKKGCYVGLIRPYIAPDPHGKNDYQVYICTSHVLNKRNYDLNWSLGNINNIKEIWGNANKNYRKTGIPYKLKSDKDKEEVDWCKSCKYCYYKNNNKLIHTVCNEMPDKNFP